MLKHRLKSGFPAGYMDLTQAYNALQSSIQQGKLVPVSVSTENEAAKIAFLVSCSLL